MYVSTKAVTLEWIVHLQADAQNVETRMIAPRIVGTFEYISGQYMRMNNS